MAQTTVSVGNRQSFLLVNIFFFYFPRKVCGKYAIRANVHILLLIILLVKMSSSLTYFFFALSLNFLHAYLWKYNVLCYINILYCRVGGIAVVLSVLVFFICLQKEEGMNLLHSLNMDSYIKHCLPGISIFYIWIWLTPWFNFLVWTKAWWSVLSNKMLVSSN